MTYSVWLKAGDLEVGVNGLEPAEALRLFREIQGGGEEDGERPPRLHPPTESAEVSIEMSKDMLDAGAAVIKRCRTDPNFVRGMSDHDVARAVFDAAVRAIK